LINGAGFEKKLEVEAINLLEPEIKLYLETENGIKLLEVEYMFPTEARCPCS
jgi:hypothetical protein